MPPSPSFESATVSHVFYLAALGLVLGAQGGKYDEYK